MICKINSLGSHKRGGQVNFVTLKQINWPSGRGATSRWTNVKLPLPNNTQCLGHGSHWVVNYNLTLTRLQLDGSCRSCSALGPRDTSRVLGHKVSTALLPNGHLESSTRGDLFKQDSSEVAEVRRSAGNLPSTRKGATVRSTSIRLWRDWNPDDTGTLEIQEHWR